MGWSYGDRFNLYAACKLMTASDLTPDEAGICLYALLERGEIYLDPAAGKDLYIFEDELQLISELGLKLHRIVGENFPIKLGSSAIAHAEWADAVTLARHLLDRLKTNGLAPAEILDATS